MRYKAIVIGVSSGGMSALKTLLPQFPANFSLPLILVQHIGTRSETQWIKMLNAMSTINIKEADEKEAIEKGNAYIAPANYHLLIEKDYTLSLSIDQKVNYARPSIDVLFESAAEVYKNQLIGIVLTGANNDGTRGMQKIKEFGGLTIVQDPKSAESSLMPASVIAAFLPDYILTLDKMVPLLVKVSHQQ